jgi:deoxycytidine triphosphate deaminase
MFGGELEDIHAPSTKVSESLFTTPDDTVVVGEVTANTFMPQHSVLSDKAINYYRTKGDIFIEPFDVKNLNNSSYDVNLAEEYYLEVKPDTISDVTTASNTPNGKQNNLLYIILFSLLGFITLNFSNPLFFLIGVATIGLTLYLLELPSILFHSTNTSTRFLFNPYSKDHVEKVWGKPMVAMTALEWFDQNKSDYNFPDPEEWPFENILEDDKIIVLRPGQNILARTQQRIGGRNTITTMMETRSSWGRSFIDTTCGKSGWGDIVECLNTFYSTLLQFIYLICLFILTFF